MNLRSVLREGFSALPKFLIINDDVSSFTFTVVFKSRLQFFPWQQIFFQIMFVMAFSFGAFISHNVENFNMKENTDQTGVITQVKTWDHMGNFGRQ